MKFLLLFVLVCVGCAPSDITPQEKSQIIKARLDRSGEYIFGRADFQSTGVAVGDFDLDGKDDLVYIDTDSSIHIVLNRGRWK